MGNFQSKHRSQEVRREESAPSAKAIHSPTSPRKIPNIVLMPKEENTARDSKISTGAIQCISDKGETRTSVTTRCPVNRGDPSPNKPAATAATNKSSHSPPTPPLPSSSSPSGPSSTFAPQTETETASGMRHRGRQHVKNKDYAKALNCHRRALALYKQESQENNEDLASHYDDLGSVYQETNAANRAASYFHKALTIRLNLHGQDHLSTASSFDRIGKAYSDQGDYERALNFHHKAKHVKKKLLGRDHKETAKSFWHIGDVHFRRKDYDSALCYCNKALDVQTRVLEDDHPHKVKTEARIGLIQDKILERANTT